MKVSVKKVKGMGRGLFATKDLRKGELVETSPVVILDKQSSRRIYGTNLASYVFAWGRDKVAIALGMGSLFNHSAEPNVDWGPKLKKNIITFKANRAIKKGEQLFIDYGYDPKEWVMEKGEWILTEK